MKKPDRVSLCTLEDCNHLFSVGNWNVLCTWRSVSHVPEDWWMVWVPDGKKSLNCSITQCSLFAPRKGRYKTVATYITWFFYLWCAVVWKTLQAACICKKVLQVKIEQSTLTKTCNWHCRNFDHVFIGCDSVSCFKKKEKEKEKISPHELMLRRDVHKYRTSTIRWPVIKPMSQQLTASGWIYQTKAYQNMHCCVTWSYLYFKNK